MNRFGIELEYKIKSPTLENIAKKHIPQFTIEQESTKFWTVKEEHCGSELTSPFLAINTSNLSKVKDVLFKINENVPKTKFGSETGVHIHFSADIPLTSQKNLFLFMYLYDRQMLNLLPIFRRRMQSSWFECLSDVYQCQISSSPKNFMINKDFSLRYKKDYDTFEFRQGQNQKNPQKTFNWIVLTIMIYAFCLDYSDGYFNREEKSFIGLLKNHTFSKYKFLSLYRGILEEFNDRSLYGGQFTNS